MSKRWLFICLLLSGFLAAFVNLCLASQVDNKLSPKEELTVEKVLGAENDDRYARALEPREFVFPRDHGPHPEFKTEWWYYTGNLSSDSGRRFGYQLTFFRTALHPEPPQRASGWATNQVYMGHFAISDPQNERFYHFERFSRDSLGLAGAEAVPFKVWLEDWSVEEEQGPSMPVLLSAKEEDLAIELRLRRVKPIVLQGQDGLSQKSSKPGNASYYYSMTRLATSGQIRMANETFKVTGTSWLDREWSTSALGENQVGWDWFSLQFDDGRELMYYQLRLKNGKPDALSSGVLVDASGASKRLNVDDLQITVLDDWQSDKSGAKYPAKWRLELAKEGLSLEISPLMNAQELNTTVRYWEGAVSVQGMQDRQKISGYGYVELTGY